MGIANGLKRICAEKGITYTELSKLSGVPVGTIYCYVKRDVDPLGSNLLDISRALEINPSELYTKNNEPTGDTLGQRIENLRSNKGLRQEDLAIASCVSRIAIGNYERDARVPDVFIAGRICKELGVTVDALLDGLLDTRAGELDGK